MYIVTGGAGFIGSNLVRALNQRGEADILVVDDLTDGQKFLNLRDCRIADYLDIDEFRELLATGQTFGNLKGVFHEGACADTTVGDGRAMLIANFTFSKLLLHWVQRQGVPLVYASSAAVYGANIACAEVPANEHPLNVYGYSKLLFDQYVRRHCLVPGSTVVGLRYFNVYGPGEAHKGKMASMAYQLFQQIKHQGVANLFQGTQGGGDGEQRRDFVYVRDVVAANLFFMDGPARQGIFNVGTGASRSFNELAQAIITKVGRGRIQYIPFPRALWGKYQSFTEANLSALRTAGCGITFTELTVGIQEAVKVWQGEIC